jgi:hypothetical protein
MILRLAVFSALIYVGFALAIEIVVFTLAKIRGSFGILMPTPTWYAFLGLFWLVSFWIAFRVSSFAK